MKEEVRSIPLSYRWPSLFNPETDLLAWRELPWRELTSLHRLSDLEAFNSFRGNNPIRHAIHFILNF
jgi:hypothetical protein